jgi:hypothetical protein
MGQRVIAWSWPLSGYLHFLQKAHQLTVPHGSGSHTPCVPRPCSLPARCAAASVVSNAPTTKTTKLRSKLWETQLKRYAKKINVRLDT